ncbi:MAG: hypothetical protein LBK64_06665 [Spirochaetaceae bacterium]|nr:hypothetical protein [Spirochaetaceae bacterium]
MFNLKLSVIAAGAAFVLSLVIGIISHAGFAYAIIRALVSGGLFFFLSVFAYWAVSQFVPELLDLSQGDASGGDGLPMPGSNVDISIDSSEDDDTGMLPPLDQQYVEPGGEGEPKTERAGFSAAQVPDPGQKSANTGTNNAAALDQGGQNGYTNGGTLVDAEDAGAESDGAGAPVLPETDGAVDTLPDLELLSTAFVPQEEEPGEEAFVPADAGGISGALSSPGKKPSTGQADFNVKEMAQAIQTILKKDEKG